MAADAAIDRFDAFLDDLALDGRGTDRGVDPSLSAAAKTLNAAVTRQTPHPDFASHLRRSLVTSTMPRSDGPNAVSIASPISPPPLPRLPLDRRAPLMEVLAVAAVALIFIGGLAATGRLSLPNWFGEDEPAHLAAPSVPSPSSGSVAMLFIVDKSGSMSYDPLGGTSKVEMAKKALSAAVRSLPDGYTIGILVFNDQQEWVVEMTTINNRATRNDIDAAIGTITADGGTEIFPALYVGFDAIRSVDADARHIILLSDGKSRTGTRESYQSLIADATSDRTTLSTVAIGDDADTDLLQFLAEQRGGSYHVANSAAELPAAVMAVIRSLVGAPVATPQASLVSPG